MRMTRYQWLLIGLLSANFGVVFLDRNVFGNVASFVQKDMGLTNGQIGDIAAAFSFSWAIAGLFMGNLVDRVGRRKLMLVICVIAFSLASVLSGFAAGFVALMSARLLMGVAEGGIMPITQTMIAVEVPHERRGLAHGITQNFGANLIANTLGPIVIIWMAETHGWRNAFFLAAVPGFLMAFLIAWLVREPDASKFTSRTKETGVIRQLLTDRNMVLCIVISILLVAFLLVFFIFTQLFLINSLHFSHRHTSWILAAWGVASIAVAFLVPGSSDKFGRKPVILVSAVLGMLMPLCLIFFAGTSFLPLMGYVAIGAALSGVFPLVMATIPSEIVSPARTTTALSLTMGLSEIIGGVFAPSIAGRVADSHGLPSTLWMLVAFAGAIFILALFLRETAPAVLARRQAAR